MIFHWECNPPAISPWGSQYWGEEGTAESVPPPNHLRAWWHPNSAFFFFSLLANRSLKFAYSEGKYEFVKLGFQSLEDIFTVVKIIFKVLPESLYSIQWLYYGVTEISTPRIYPKKSNSFEENSIWRHSWDTNFLSSWNQLNINLSLLFLVNLCDYIFTDFQSVNPSLRISLKRNSYSSC